MVLCRENAVVETPIDSAEHAQTSLEPAAYIYCSGIFEPRGFLFIVKMPASQSDSACAPKSLPQNCPYRLMCGLDFLISFAAIQCLSTPARSRSDGTNYHAWLGES